MRVRKHYFYSKLGFIYHLMSFCSSIQDAFRYLRRDCSHWFLTHFHIDHYQGLTKSFCHGKIYCSLITAKLINLKIGIPSERVEVLPLNQKITIAGIEVACMDANHCPGSIIILFKPPNGKEVLHTGDFRFSEEMASLPALSSHIHTLILDTTYCNPQYDFPKQEAIIQFVIEAIQAEDFNPKTLFLIGSYTIGKERLFLEVARALRKKVYVDAAKMRLLHCLELKDEDLFWFTSNEHESQIHVVPMWTLASIKRLKQISNQYMRRFNLIVAFSPTGWTFGKGKNKSPGKRWKQGTLIRYEVPYSEHSSFTELKEFVKLVSPANIIPSVNNDSPEAAAQMISLLTS
uniref:DNA repair metallo-beta-lactamase domain-containing protein n=1 Tax=Kalanchoe fedtschenkoi TaxID=63787 RepID=A0A7N0ZXY8_KALFE